MGPFLRIRGSFPFPPHPRSLEWHFYDRNENSVPRSPLRRTIEPVNERPGMGLARRIIRLTRENVEWTGSDGYKSGNAGAVMPEFVYALLALILLFALGFVW